jgi:hypothetical protein
MVINWNNLALRAVSLPSGDARLSMGIFMNGDHRYGFHQEIKQKYYRNMLLVVYLLY